MAAQRPEAVAKSALKKLEDQLTCAICLGTFTDPKMLNHRELLQTFVEIVANLFVRGAWRCTVNGKS